MRNNGTRGGGNKRGPVVTLSAPPSDELLTIPRLGPRRAQSLADVGITTLDQLRDIREEDLAAVKWVGAGNARLIKDWLRGTGAAVATRPVVSDHPAQNEHATEVDDVAPPEISDDFGKIDTAITALKEKLPKKSREKKLGRQLKKVKTSVSDLSGNLEDLEAGEKVAASVALDRIASLLRTAVESGKLSAKKQEAMGAELKKIRKRLEKALGG